MQMKTVIWNYFLDPHDRMFSNGHYLIFVEMCDPLCKKVSESSLSPS